jgi:hypothetical protein
MAWIKIQHGLHNKPEVFSISRRLGISANETVGLLVKFWCWCDENSVDGCVDHLQSTDVDNVVGCPEFGDALLAVKWIVFSPQKAGFLVTNFTRHNGESAKKRALKNNAQAKWRKGSGGAVDAPQSTTRSTNRSTREEKRREDKSKPKTLKPPIQDKVITSIKECTRGVNSETGEISDPFARVATA